MAVAFDTVGPSSAGVGITSAGSTTALSWTHTTGAGANAILVGVNMDDGNNETLTATCNGTAMTSLGIIDTAGDLIVDANFQPYLQMFLATTSVTASSANAIVVTASAALASGAHIDGGSLSFSGYTQHGTVATAFTVKTATIPANTSGNVIAAFFSAGNTITQAGAPATARFLINQAGNSSFSTGNTAGVTAPSTGSSVTVTWTTSAGSCCSIAVEMKGTALPSGGGPIYLQQQLAGLVRRRRRSSQRPQFNLGGPNASINPLTVTATVAIPAASAATGTAYITGLAGVPGPGYFIDQFGKPRLWVATETWGIIVNAGAWSGSGGGTWQQDIDNFTAARSSQGFTVIMTDPVWAESGNPVYNGNTWDGVHPLTSGNDPTITTLNATFWARVDYLIASAAAKGITIGLDIQDGADAANATGFMNGWTNTEWTAWATLVGIRYKNTPNLVWLVGNDAFSPTSDGAFNACIGGLAAAGATQPVTPWYNAECTARYQTDTDTAEGWGVTNAQFNFCYTYNAGYFVMEYAYNEVTHNGQAHLLPVIWGDGYFYTGGGASYYAPTDRAMRQEWWWCLASGARGILGESENVYPWGSGAAVTAVTGNVWFGTMAASITAAYQSWTGWHLLLPDLASALVTAGRGTRVTGFSSGGSGGQYESAFTNSYVAASKTPDGTLAVCYLPNATTITVNTALLAAGWAAHWIDPVSGASSSAGAGPTFNSTAKGTNSQGDPDWVLVFQVPPAPLPELAMATRIAP